MESRSPGRYFRRSRNERSHKKEKQIRDDWRNCVRICGILFPPSGTIVCLQGLTWPRLPARTTLLRANRLYFLPAMQTSSWKPILNWYPGFPGPTQAIAVVVYRPIDVFRHATPRGVFSAICCLSAPTTQKDSRCACVKAIPRREALTTAEERPLRPAIFLINRGPVSEIRS